MKNPFRNLWRLAVNHLTEGPVGMALGLAANISAEPMGAGEWHKLCPYFEGDYWECDAKGKWKKFKQIVTRADAQQMQAAFNAERQARGDSFRGLPIYKGHPDADPKRWPDESRLGGVVGFEAREDGIWLQTALNDEGERNRQQGYLIYPSPAWPYDLRLKEKSGIIRPVELRSIGMTNLPRISQVPAWTNADDPAAPGGSQFADNNPATPANQTTMKKDHRAMLISLLQKHHDPKLSDEATNEEVETAYNEMMKKPSLCGTATNADPTPLALAINGKTFDLKIVGEAPTGIPEEITAAINSATAPLETQIGTLTIARDAATAEATKFRGLAVNALKAEAINLNRLSAAEWSALEPKFATNFDEAAAELQAKKSPKLNTKPLGTLTPSNAADISTPGGRQLAFNTRLDALTRPAAQGGQGLSIDGAINAMRANADDAALLKAMETPAK